MIKTFIPPILLLDAAYPFLGYVQLAVEQMNLDYLCAAAGGEDGFSTEEGEWEDQYNYINHNIQYQQTFYNIPIYFIYVNIMNSLALLDVFATLAA